MVPQGPRARLLEGLRDAPNPEVRKGIDRIEAIPARASIILTTCGDGDRKALEAFVPAVPLDTVVEVMRYESGGKSVVVSVGVFDGNPALDEFVGGNRVDDPPVGQ